MEGSIFIEMEIKPYILKVYMMFNSANQFSLGS